MAIADALVVSPGDLLKDDDDRPSTSPVVRRDERHIIEDPLCRREYLMHLDDPYLEVAELFVAPGGQSRPALAKHLGRDYGVVIEGEVVVEFSHGTETLGPGDYIAFDSGDPHRIVNASDRPARVLWIVVLAGGERRVGPRGRRGGGD
ncbi:cupin domain-containing protein [Baekduia soli]|uniref:cupin domain-containing protein n=1 Tax=Baekduia soli TaxID=496014 RepID=UPI00225DDB94|nr:cupin domain-containing protein [Baekduia soli]